MEQAIEGQREYNEQIHPVEVTVNERPVTLPDRTATGLGIKQAAIAQGVPIQLDFVLQQEVGNGKHKVIGDQDQVKLHPHDRFTAIADDDNS
jgi:hypothetical protein